MLDLKQSILTTSENNNDELDTYRTYDTELLDVSLQDHGKVLVNRVQKICFHPRVMIKETLHFKNYSQEELINSWYSKKEFELIREEIQEILVNQEADLEDPDYDFALRRGLEGMTEQGAKRQEQNRRAGWAAVLRDRQCSSHESATSYRGIALAYSLVSQWSVMEAVQRAKEDVQTQRQPQQNRFQAKKPISNKLTRQIRPKLTSCSIQRLLRKLSGC
jgi:hypothetical protein